MRAIEVLTELSTLHAKMERHAQLDDQLLEKVERIELENTDIRAEVERLREALHLAWEWSAKYPLQGAPSAADRDAANSVYQACCAALEDGK
jgi:hypothetical protein